MACEMGHVDLVKYLVEKAKCNVGEYRLTHSTITSTCLFTISKITSVNLLPNNSLN